MKLLIINNVEKEIKSEIVESSTISQSELDEVLTEYLTIDVDSSENENQSIVDHLLELEEYFNHGTTDDKSSDVGESRISLPSMKPLENTDNNNVAKPVMISKIMRPDSALKGMAGDWRCPACFCHNFSWKPQCRSCGLDISYSWTCPSCNLTNWRAWCKICELNRDSSWTCPECNLNNWRDCCRSCGLSRDSWTCPGCNLINMSSSQACEACSYDRQCFQSGIKFGGEDRWEPGSFDSSPAGCHTSTTGQTLKDWFNTLPSYPAGCHTSTTGQTPKDWFNTLPSCPTVIPSYTPIWSGQRTG